MAIWQFGFSLVPAEGILRYHGKAVEVLPEYGMHDPESNIKELDEFPNYWIENEMSSPYIRSLEKLLPACPSWSDDAKMFGVNESDNIIIWNDDIYCAIDARNVNMELLSKIIEITRNMNCKIVLKDGGRVISPDLSVVLSELNRSSAVKFINDPRGFLKSREKP